MSPIAMSIRWILDKAGLLVLIIVFLVAAYFFRELQDWIRSAEVNMAALEATRASLAGDLREAEEILENTKERLKHEAGELADAEEFAFQSRDIAKQCLVELAKCGWVCQVRDYKEYKRKELECRAKSLMADSLEREVEKVRQNPIFRIYVEQEQLVGDLERKLAAQEELVRERRELLESGLPNRILKTVKQVLPMAVAILLGLLAMPLAIRWIFYYLLAPRATRLPPITILPVDDPPQPEQLHRSAVSLKITLNDGEELIVQPTFIAGLGYSARARTQWFLNKHLPFASIASGMFLLTRIRPQEHGTNEVVLGATQDPLDEVGVIELPEGAAMVVQPRSLAGIVKPIGVPVEISRHWRIGSLHAWLTLQLRYLVFHGPCKLIIKGCRGFSLDAPGSEPSRMIRQSATIGWSANLGYKTIRCEAFMPYLRGKEELFNDMFLGEQGKFAYEQMPSWGRRKGALSRGMEGVFDAFLKAFGI